jgi:hypothetical protein
MMKVKAKGEFDDAEKLSSYITLVITVLRNSHVYEGGIYSATSKKVCSLGPVDTRLRLEGDMNWLATRCLLKGGMKRHHFPEKFSY